MKKILILGSSNTDMTVKTPTLPAPGETVLGGVFTMSAGGKGANEVISESESMKQYLISRGIPEGSIIEENRSTSTLENMKFSKEIIYAHDPAAKVIFSTTNYHVFRSGLCARRIKMRAVGIGAKAKWYFWPNAMKRTATAAS